MSMGLNTQHHTNIIHTYMIHNNKINTKIIHNNIIQTDMVHTNIININLFHAFQCFIAIYQMIIF
jgi:hypothetical protein